MARSSKITTEDISAIKREFSGGKRVSEISEELGIPYSTVRYYVQFVTGRKSVAKHEYFKGCDEDCFHCRYSDCIAPYLMMGGGEQNAEHAVG